MKKFFLLMICCAFFGVAQVNAQSCNKSKSASADKTACCAKTAKAAAKAASLDDTIESRTCETTGKVSYVKKSVCPMTGAAKYSEVKYSKEEASFVSVKAEAEAKKSACTSAEKKACSKGEKKACTKGEKKACTKGTKAKATKVGVEGECAKKASEKKS